MSRSYSKNGLKERRLFCIVYSMIAPVHVVPRTQPECKPLTCREREILHLIEAGRASKQIADALGISTNTVNNHRAAILGKLGTHSALEALRIYRQALAPGNPVKANGPIGKDARL
jgi:DNA-binding CsgD family transcriptional regulator